MAWGIREGMLVRDGDGEPLGVVAHAYNGEFTLDPGDGIPEGLVLHHDDIRSLGPDEIVLMRPRAELRWIAAPAVNDESPVSLLDDREALRIPLADEEVLAERFARPTGQVRVRKRIVTEEKTISVTVPVRREELIIEELPVGTGAPEAGATRGTAPSQVGEGVGGIGESTLIVPLHEERVEVQKRAYVYEEVVITKEVVREVRRLDVPVRREVAHVWGNSDLCWEDE
jgi:uncharacterized protein (TIGR02271 family)